MSRKEAYAETVTGERASILIIIHSQIFYGGVVLSVQGRSLSYIVYAASGTWKGVVSAFAVPVGQMRSGRRHNV